MFEKRSALCQRCVPEHLAQGDVLIDQLLQAVVVDIQVEPEYTADQNRPQGHAGAASVFIDLRRNLAFQQFKDRRAQREVGVDVLQAAQYLRNIVA